MILVIDNYDSFVYNLARYLVELGGECLIKRNDEIDLDTVKQINPSHIVISPGPCTPNEAGISLELIKNLAPKIPLLGICLGHQCIAQAFGGKIVPAKQPRHGKYTQIFHDNSDIFTEVNNPCEAALYHSLAVDSEFTPDDLRITARDANDEIMALQHTQFPTYGLQFHPESVLTQQGYTLLRNFLSL